MLKERVSQELSNVREEMSRAECEDLNVLEGWEKALRWVLKQVEEEEVA